ncbi:MAG: response regulator, partial [Rhodospirillales bacterium]|nr:response regulator [Rhodospirillales bacterium]
MQNDDVLLFSDEDEPEPPRTFSAVPWKILIVDDDQEVHAVTRIALDGMTYSGRPVVFLSAHSGAAAVRTMADEPDVAVILLDVVMETDDAGLRVVRRVREELGNANVRIVLRTGQPGQAP